MKPLPRRLVPYALLTVPLCLAVTSAAPQAQGKPGTDGTLALRRLILDERFAEARVELARWNDDPRSAAFRALIDECDLAARCDQAQAMLDAGKSEEAKALLQGTLTALPANLSSGPRARGLLALAEGSGAPSAPPEAGVSLKELDRALAVGEKGRERREAWVADILLRVDATMEDNVRKLGEAEKALADQRGGDAEKLFGEVKSGAAGYGDWIKAVEPYLDPNAYRQRHKRADEAMRDHLARVAAGLGRLYYEMEAYTRAKEAVDEGLARDPLNGPLLELRVRIEEWARLRD